MHQFPILEILICDIVKRKVIKKILMAILHRPYLSQKFSPQLVNKTFRNISSDRERDRDFIVLCVI